MPSDWFRHDVSAVTGLVSDDVIMLATACGSASPLEDRQPNGATFNSFVKEILPISFCMTQSEQEGVVTS